MKYASAAEMYEQSHTSYLCAPSDRFDGTRSALGGGTSSIGVETSAMLSYKVLLLGADSWTFAMSQVALSLGSFARFSQDGSSPKLFEGPILRLWLR